MHSSPRHPPKGKCISSYWEAEETEELLLEIWWMGPVKEQLIELGSQLIGSLCNMYHTCAHFSATRLLRSAEEDNDNAVLLL